MALFNMLYARRYKGAFILRIEDTDQKRSRPEYEELIYQSLKWLGIEWDEGPDVGGPHGPYRQSERSDIYKEYAMQLVREGKAYKCFATPEELKEMREVASKRGGRIGYDRRYRNLSEGEIAAREAEGQPYVVRLKVPLTGECEYVDEVKGRLTTPWADVDDQVILKSDGFPTYHLANVVDDHLMEITHVIRGDEWLSSTPKHILLYEAFGWEAPTFLHMPLLLGANGKKLSKRKNPTSVFFYRDSGYLPEAFLNFLTLMGYRFDEEREIYSLDDVIATFDPKKIGVSGAFFDIKKLDWLNQHYLIHSIAEGELWNAIKSWSFSDERMGELMPLVHTRIKTFGEFFELCGFLFVNTVPLSTDLFAPKKISEQTAASILQCYIWSLEQREEWARDAYYEASKEVAAAFGINHKKVVMPLLFGAITGAHFGPPLFDAMAWLGKERVRARLMGAIDFLGGLSKKASQLLSASWESGSCETLVATSSSTTSDMM